MELVVVVVAVAALATRRLLKRAARCMAIRYMFFGGKKVERW